jgi:hypothetical protein
MTQTTFDFGRGHVFVAGLFWQPLPGQLRDRKKETERLAKELSFDLAVWRTTGSLQVGFAQASKLIKVGQLSAAAVVSKTLDIEHGARNFLCATEVPGGKWLYVAQRDGIILPDGDLVASEDEIRSRMLSDLSLSEWSTIYAPDHWGVPAAEERTFEQFIPKKGGVNSFKGWWGLRPVKRNAAKTFLPLALLVVVAVAGAVGYRMWQEKKAAQEMALLVSEQAGTGNQPVKVEHPWKTKPRASKFLDECLTAFGKVKTLWPGNWALRDATCSGGVFTVVWLRQENGWIEHLRAVEPKAVLSTDGGMASLVIPLALDGIEDEALPNESERTLAFHGTGQQYGFKVALSAPTQPPTLPGDKQAPQPVKDWKELAWKIDGIALPPSVVVKTLDAAGFRVTRIKASFKGGVMNWDLEGIQYVQP